MLADRSDRSRPRRGGLARRSPVAPLDLAAAAVSLIVLASFALAAPATVHSQEPPAAGSDAAAGIRDLVRGLSRALQAGNAPLFLAAFDRRAFGGFQRLREQVSALTEQRRIASSVESAQPVSDAGSWSVRVNWLLELTPREGVGPIERRHEVLVLRLVRGVKRWRIADLEPADFFAARRQSPR